MELSTPTNGLIKNGELRGIGDAYVRMLNESAEEGIRKALFTNIYESVKKNNFGRLVKFARKNAKLAKATLRKSVEKACKGVDCGMDAKAKKEVCDQVEEALCRELPAVEKARAPMGRACGVRRFKTPKARLALVEAEYQDEDDDVENGRHDDDDTDLRGFRPDRAGSIQGGPLDKDVVDEIERLTKGIKTDNEIPPEMKRDLMHDPDAAGSLEDEQDYGDDDQDQDQDYEDGDDDEDQQDAKDFCVTSIRMAVRANGRPLGKPVWVFVGTHSDRVFRTQDLHSVEDVLRYANETSGCYFDIDDFTCDFARARATGRQPMVIGRRRITPDFVSGSRAFNRFFGPEGQFADYLYKADGTPRFAPDSPEGRAADGARRDATVVERYPEVIVGITFIARDSHTGKPVPVEPEDFDGLRVKVEEAAPQNGQQAQQQAGGQAQNAPQQKPTPQQTQGQKPVQKPVQKPAQNPPAQKASTDAAQNQAQGGRASVNEETNSERQALVQATQQFADFLNGLDGAAQQAMGAAKAVVLSCKEDTLLGACRNLYTQTQNIASAIRRLGQIYQNDLSGRLMS